MKKKITKELKELFRKNWIKALRSGRYKQTTSVLADDEGYCCLGVACKVYDKMFPKELKIGVDYYNRGRECKTFDDCDTVLPKKVQDALGLRTPGGYWDQDNGEIEPALTDWNDNGKTFKEIAALIESKPKGLFKRGT